ncbi:MAG TPA: hypothetical protein VLW75_02270 [Rhizomicrobium sp.]|nr:hypothetical protein [Rhizomicrobium sp.]
MDEQLAELELRITVLETLVAFGFAAQHMQTADPADAMRRLRALLVERIARATGEGRQREIAAELERVIKRIADLQTQLPRRLVD